MSRPLRIVQLYSRDMNIYGDWGNVLTVLRRAQWQGLSTELIEYNPGDEFPGNVDILIGGGGQDAGQDKVQQDLLDIAPRLRELADSGTPMLVICGLYQLFGNFFKTKDGQLLEGARVFDIETHGGTERLIGNIVTSSSEFGEIIGYENHSGLTFLGENTTPLARIVRGAGNNGQDEFEGARYNNVIGSYLHGSLLPKNPQIADWLIKTAMINKTNDYTPASFNDPYVKQARVVASKRPR